MNVAINLLSAAFNQDYLNYSLNMLASLNDVRDFCFSSFFSFITLSLAILIHFH